ncbi:hypothetical protein [Pseudogracilibacillus auburnensis]|uniref:hypothetical protein n=1 Tax=Pseudogracilibacillus auburnensis TaxID=1494959 RepID=UPI001A96E16C|nr:hypothetical protein [Pseudogracilibacillus auburnensis]MBO1003863.1 hypothetical protein [Pseudogracilibacillus auburnensis]
MIGEKYKTVWLLLLMIASIGLLFGCSKNEQISTNDPSDDSLDIEAIESNFDMAAFEEKYPSYYVEFETDSGFESIFIMNYDPYDFDHLPEYQEVVQYGFVSLTIEDVVYAVDILEGDDFYSAEFDAETGAVLSEEGDWAPDGEDLSKFVEEKLEMMEWIIVKSNATAK